MNEWLQLMGGGVLLYFGAEWFVGGASALALSLRVPQILVGLTVVAYGTSAPEVIVGLQAVATGHGDVVLGNVIGSNIANIGLILGVAALIRPARVDRVMRRRELPMLLVSAAIVPLLLVDGVVSRGEAAGLILVAVAYTGWMIRAARSASSLAAVTLEAAATREAAYAAGAPKPIGAPRAALTAAAGLSVLLIGGSTFVDGAVAVASVLGMSERLVGLTIVAVGTSLPELITSVVAARRGHSDLAVGNVVGSNIFNTFLCLGFAGLMGAVGDLGDAGAPGKLGSHQSLGSIVAPLHTIAVDLAALGVMTCVAAVFIRSERTISRREGAWALALYFAFAVIAVARG